VNRQAYLAALAALTADPSPDVRETVCVSLGTLAESNLALIWPQMGAIMEYQLACLAAREAPVAIAASNFWVILAELMGEDSHAAEVSTAVSAALPRLVPALLNRMVLSDEDIAAIAALESDKPEDVRPHIYRSRPAVAAGTPAASAAGAADPAAAASPAAASSADDGDDASDAGDDDDAHAEVDNWSPRRACSAALDVLAMHAGDEMLLPVLLPDLQRLLSATGDSSAAWLQREVGVFALGTISEGCMDGIGPHLPNLIPFLLKLCSDAVPFVRATSAWCLSCYATWIVEMDDAKALAELIRVLLQLTQDRSSKKAQQQACVALISVFEVAQDSVVPHAPAIAAAVISALGFYGQRNRKYLFDVAGALFESIGPAARSADVGGVLLSALLQRYVRVRAIKARMRSAHFSCPTALFSRYNDLPDADPELVPVLEAVTAATTAVGTQLADAAPRLYSRALRLIEHDVVMELAAAGEAAAAGNAEPLKLDKTLTIAALDLLGGLAEAFGRSFDELIAVAGPTLPDILFECLQMPSPSVRQSAFALLGELAETSYARLAPRLSPIIVACAASIRDTVHNAKACNNAVWALGRIAMSAGPAFAAAPAVALVVPRLTAIIAASDRTLAMLVENTAIALGRIACVAPQALAPTLGSFVGLWCSALVKTSEPTERKHAHEGLCNVLALNPAGAVPALGNVAVVFALYEDASPECVAVMRGLLLRLRELGGAAAWGALVARMGAPLKQKVASRFGRDVL
jgi:transportin-1